MGNVLNENSLGILMKAPIGMAIIGYYMLGNRQMFFDEMPKINYSSQPYNPGHSLIDYDGGLNVTFVMFVVGVMILIFGFYNIALQKFGRMIKLFKIPKTEKGENGEESEEICDENWEITLDVDEKLGRYFECLKGSD